MKTLWFSKDGKITLKVILWIIIWIFFAIWVGITWITHLQWNDYDNAPNVYEMIQNLMYDYWLGNYKYKDSLNNADFGRYICLDSNWKDEVVEVNDDFTQWEWEWRYFYIKIPTHSKFFDDNVRWEEIYWEEKDRRWNRVTSWFRIHELKIEVEDVSYILSSFTLGRNPGKNHFWERSAWIIENWPSRFSEIGSWGENWKTMCIILTPQNPITKTEISAHDEWCEFWSLPKNSYDETYLNLIFGWEGDDWNAKVKISHITVDLPNLNLKR